MDKTCGSCTYWRREKAGTVVVVGQPAKGECREGPPSIISLKITQDGAKIGTAMVTAYPEPLETMPACSRHQQREEPVNQV